MKLVPIFISFPSYVSAHWSCAPIRMSYFTGEDEGWSKLLLAINSIPVHRLGQGFPPSANDVRIIFTLSELTIAQVENIIKKNTKTTFSTILLIILDHPFLILKRKTQIQYDKVPKLTAVWWREFYHNELGKLCDELLHHPCLNYICSLFWCQHQPLCPCQPVRARWVTAEEVDSRKSIQNDVISQFWTGTVFQGYFNALHHS